MTIQGSIPIRAKENLKGMVEESQPIPAANARKIPEPPSRRIPDTAAEAIKVWLTTHNESSQAAGEDSELYGSEESFVTAVVEIATSFFSPRNDQRIKLGRFSCCDQRKFYCTFKSPGVLDWGKHVT
jgi:hypothetical protein